MIQLPRLALSIRQPWAWAIAHSTKRLENRSLGAVRHMPHRGPICLHASLGMTQDEYYKGSHFMLDIGVECPAPHELQRGGIIAVANLVDVISDSDDPWFFGPRALVLEDVQPVDFVACKGALGLFDWRQGAIFDGPPDAPKKWMLPKAAIPAPELLL